MGEKRPSIGFHTRTKKGRGKGVEDKRTERYITSGSTNPVPSSSRSDILSVRKKSL